MPKRGYGLGLLLVQGLASRALGFSGFSRAFCGNLYKGLEFRDVWGLGFVQVSFCKGLFGTGVYRMRCNCGALRLIIGFSGGFFLGL